MLDTPLNGVQTVREKIKQRRLQMLVHSCIYYELDDSIIDDHLWQKWANELRELQDLFGWEIGFYDAEFFGWNGSTGCYLPLRDPTVLSKARSLLRARGR